MTFARGLMFILAKLLNAAIQYLAMRLLMS